MMAVEGLMMAVEGLILNVTGSAEKMVPMGWVVGCY
jgi:hypothetical protein